MMLTMERVESGMIERDLRVAAVRESGLSRAETARRFGISPDTVTDIVARVRNCPNYRVADNAPVDRGPHFAERVLDGHDGIDAWICACGWWSGWTWNAERSFGRHCSRPIGRRKCRHGCERWGYIEGQCAQHLLALGESD